MERRRDPAAAAGALAALKARDRTAGVEFDATELPDCLAAVLQFAATADLAGGPQLLQEQRAGLELLRLALLEAATLYAGPSRRSARCYRGHRPPTFTTS